jgi:uncharacterized protein (TIGR03000 family)
VSESDSSVIYESPSDVIYDSGPAQSEGTIIDTVPEAGGVETGPIEGQPTPAGDDSAAVGRDEGMLLVTVPAGAKLVVNGQETRSEGELRRFVSGGLKAGYQYPYQVKAIYEVDGRRVEETKEVQLRAGEALQLAFEAPKSLETKLTVKVPEDAKLILAGSPTTSTGAVRVFATDGLKPGQAWSNYTILVQLELGGRTLSKQETITLHAGEDRTLEFNFDQEQVASR